MFKRWPKRQINIIRCDCVAVHKHTDIGIMKSTVLSLISPLLFLFRKLYYSFIHKTNTYYNFCNLFQKFEYNLMIINQNNLCTKKFNEYKLKEHWLKEAKHFTNNII